MRVLFFDTETTGLPSKILPWDHPDQPHLMELGFVLKNAPDKELLRGNFLVKVPPEIHPHPRAFAAHGIITSETIQWGLTPMETIRIFRAALQVADKVVAYNIAFDVSIINTLTSRWDELNCFPRHDSTFLFDMLPRCRAECQIPPTPAMYGAGFRGYKSPTLSEAVKHILGLDHRGHRALQDVEAIILLWEHFFSYEPTEDL